MIRYPERFHASDTPGASRMRPAVEVDYNATPRPGQGELDARGRRARGDASAREPRPTRFDFAALMEALG